MSESDTSYSEGEYDDFNRSILDDDLKQRDGILHSDDDESEPSKDISTDSEPEEAISKRERKQKKPRNLDQDKSTVFIGNLPVLFTEKQVKKIFSSLAPVQSLRFRSVPVDPSSKMPRRAAVITKTLAEGASTKNCYVVLKNSEDVASVVDHFSSSEARTVLGGPFVRVTPAESKDIDHKHSVFVGHIPFNATEEELYNHFASFGEIHNVRIVKDKVTRKGKGFGFITFEDDLSVIAALSLNGSQMGDQQLRVTRAMHPKKAKKGLANQPPSKHPQPRGRQATPSQKSTRSSTSRSQSAPIVKTKRTESASGEKVFSSFFEGIHAKKGTKIAAGEIIHRPANALKEMMENSLDAGATSINVTIKDGGIKLLQIRDDGSGIHMDDLKIICERFTTSKLTKFDDLSNLQTFGFRGEALASISHIAHLSITSLERGSTIAYCASYLDGKILNPETSPRPCASIPGTVITVEDLFYNMLARKNALSSPSEEQARCVEVVSHYAIHYPRVSFTLRKQNEQVPLVATQARNAHGTSATDSDLFKLEIHPIRSVFGTNLSREVVFVEHRISDPIMCEIHGYVSQPSYHSHRGLYIFFINNRLVDCTPLKRAVDDIYRKEFSLPRGCHPFVSLSLFFPQPDCVDHNVHPAKSEVHFLHEERIIGIVTNVIKEKLLAEQKEKTFHVDNIIASQGVSDLPQRRQPETEKRRKTDFQTLLSPPTSTPPNILSDGILSPRQPSQSDDSSSSRPRLTLFRQSSDIVSPHLLSPQRPSPSRMVRTDHTQTPNSLDRFFQKEGSSRAGGDADQDGKVKRGFDEQELDRHAEKRVMSNPSLASPIRSTFTQLTNLEIKAFLLLFHSFSTTLHPLNALVSDLPSWCRTVRSQPSEALVSLLRVGVLVGFVNWEHILFQSGTGLVLANLCSVGQEMMLQAIFSSVLNVIADRARQGRPDDVEKKKPEFIALSPSVSVVSTLFTAVTVLQESAAGRVLLGMDSDLTGEDPASMKLDEEEMRGIAAGGARRLWENRAILERCFGVVLRSEGGRIKNGVGDKDEEDQMDRVHLVAISETIPGFTPDLSVLPLVLLRLTVEVEWEQLDVSGAASERAAVEQISRVLSSIAHQLCGLFFIPREDEESMARRKLARLKQHGKSGSTLGIDEAALAQPSNGSRYSFGSLPEPKFRNQLQHIFIPYVFKHLVPPLSFETDGSITQIADMNRFYKASEIKKYRCDVFSGPLINREQVERLLTEEMSDKTITIKSVRVLLDFFAVDTLRVIQVEKESITESHVAILCFSLHEKDTLLSLVQIAHQIRQQDSRIPIILMGLDSDIWHDEDALQQNWLESILRPSNVLTHQPDPNLPTQLITTSHLSMRKKQAAQSKQIGFLKEPVHCPVLPSDIEIVLRTIGAVDCLYLPALPINIDEVFADNWEEKSEPRFNDPTRNQSSRVVTERARRMGEESIGFGALKGIADVGEQSDVLMEEERLKKWKYSTEVMTQICRIAMMHSFTQEKRKWFHVFKKNPDLRPDIESSQMIPLSPKRLDLRFKGLLQVPPPNKLPPHPLHSREMIEHLIAVYEGRIVENILTTFKLQKINGMDGVKSILRTTKKKQIEDRVKLTTVEAALLEAIEEQTQQDEANNAAGATPSGRVRAFSVTSSPSTIKVNAPQIAGANTTGTDPTLTSSTDKLLPQTQQSDGQTPNTDTQQGTVEPLCLLRVENLPVKPSQLCPELDLSYNAIVALPEEHLAQFNHVVYLNLSFNGLTSLPNSLAALKSLKRLSLGSNFFASFNTVLPASLISLNLSSNLLNEHSIFTRTTPPNLEEIDLSFNVLKDIPDSILKINTLLSLTLTGNQITVLSPVVDKCFPELLHLGLAGNHLQSIPASTKIPSLMSLSIEYNQLVEVPMHSFFHKAKQKHVSLVGNFLAQLPANLSFWQFVTFLDLSENKLNSLPDGISACANLEVLLLKRNLFTKLPEHLDNVPKLSYLDVSFNKLVLLAATKINLGKTITVLNLSGNELVALPNQLNNLTSLSRLIVSDNLLQVIPESLASCDHLSYVDVSKNPFIAPPPNLLSSHEIKIKFANTPLSDRLDGITEASVKWICQTLRSHHQPLTPAESIGRFISSLPNPVTEQDEHKVLMKIETALMIPKNYDFNSESDTEAPSALPTPTAAKTPKGGKTPKNPGKPKQSADHKVHKTWTEALRGAPNAPHAPTIPEDGLKPLTQKPRMMRGKKGGVDHVQFMSPSTGNVGGAAFKFRDKNDKEFAKIRSLLRRLKKKTLEKKRRIREEEKKKKMEKKLAKLRAQKAQALRGGTIEDDSDTDFDTDSGDDTTLSSSDSSSDSSSNSWSATDSDSEGKEKEDKLDKAAVAMIEELPADGRNRRELNDALLDYRKTIKRHQELFGKGADKPTETIVEKQPPQKQPMSEAEERRRQELQKRKKEEETKLEQSQLASEKREQEKQAQQLATILAQTTPAKKKEESDSSVSDSSGSYETDSESESESETDDEKARKEEEEARKKKEEEEARMKKEKLEQMKRIQEQKARALQIKAEREAAAKAKQSGNLPPPPAPSNPSPPNLPPPPSDTQPPSSSLPPPPSSLPPPPSSLSPSPTDLPPPPTDLPPPPSADTPLPLPPPPSAPPSAPKPTPKAATAPAPKTTPKVLPKTTPAAPKPKPAAPKQVQQAPADSLPPPPPAPPPGDGLSEADLKKQREEEMKKKKMEQMKKIQEQREKALQIKKQREEEAKKKEEEERLRREEEQKKRIPPPPAREESEDSSEETSESSSSISIHSGNSSDDDSD
ncbi:putative DNA mismatch repair protein Mlh1 [Blattamonas nauphoetae]|uniref:DNA mismatch repair protein Mlh1 n=1 Tax=Blattamonas nauphoetae TaxID=2049346 RepID=A0ABQ9XK10_9EUKA|nr:putative DNA mismatch repair protein Mlh1 [Blattamonas nauphoetae]